MVNARFGGDVIGQAALVTAPGLMVGSVILSMGAVSGAHPNPGVRLAFAMRGDFPKEARARLPRRGRRGRLPTSWSRPIGRSRRGEGPLQGVAAAAPRHLDKDRARIGRSEELSPLLLFRDSHGGKVVVADGYHRLCAVYSFDEDAMFPCKIV
jgi:hypothetical protein